MNQPLLNDSDVPLMAFEDSVLAQMTNTNDRISEVKVEIVEDAADIVNQASSHGSLNKHEFSMSVKEHSKSND